MDGAPTATEVLDTLLGPAKLLARVDSLLETAPGFTGQATANGLDISLYEANVKWSNKAYGYGFIARHAGGVDAFTPASTIQTDGYRSCAENVARALNVGGKLPATADSPPS